MKIKAQVQHPLLFEVLCEEVELSNTHTAHVMHIPNTLNLISTRNNSKQKLQ